MACHGDTESVQPAMACVLLLIFIAVHSHLAASGSGWSGRTLQSDLSLSNGRNWQGGRPPCEADRLVFRPQASLTLVLSRGQTSLRGLVLPTSAELLLPVTGSLQFTGKTHTATCNGRDVVFTHARPLRWLDARNWDGWNRATPDLERVPCATDAVRLPSSALAALQMTLPPVLRLGRLEINDKTMDPEEWSEYVVGGEGSRQFTTEEEFGEGEREEEGDPPQLELTFDTCHGDRWCECRNDYLRPLLCTEQCPVPLCKRPVKPRGFCCPFCGAYFLLRARSEDAPRLGEHLRRALADGSVAWHASWQGESGDGGLLQVVLANTGEYAGDIERTATDLKASLEHSGAGWVAVELHASGHVWYPSTLSSVITHFLSLFVFAALTVAAVIVFYSQEWSWAGLSHPEGGRPFMFARFMGEGDGEGGRVVVASDPPPVPPVQSFDNPLYGNTNTQQSTERTEEVTNVASESLLEGQTFDNPMYGVAQDEGSTLDCPVYCELAEAASKYSDSLEDTETPFGSSKVM